MPPRRISTEIWVAPASMEFSTISLITDAGRSTTSPAAILLTVNSSNTTMAYNRLKDQDSTTALSALRNAAHDTLYSMCNTLYRQYEYAQSISEGKDVDMEMFEAKTGNQASASNNWWIIALVAFDIVVIGSISGWGYCVFIREKKERKHEGKVN